MKSYLEADTVGAQPQALYLAPGVRAKISPNLDYRTLKKPGSL